MRNAISILLFFISSFCLSQETRVIAAKIIDSNTKLPLEFVNIGFLNKDIGTTTTTSGHFIISYETDRIGPHDVLQISFLGYETRRITFDQLKRLSTDPVTIALTPSVLDLTEVVLKSTPRKKKTIGHTAFTAASMGYWEGKEAIGGEIASVIQIKKEKTKLHGLHFNILQNASDSLRIRIKIYDFEGGEPTVEMTGKDIIHTITKKKGMEYISLDAYHIKVDNDVLISIELVEAFGPRIYFSLSASAYGGMSFIREKDYPYWMIQKTVCVGFKVESSYPINEKDLAMVQKDKP
ncbi:MAG: carboxypeptidase-like regulatory domain-containing protein [Bacteroidota bacterium]